MPSRPVVRYSNTDRLEWKIDALFTDLFYYYKYFYRRTTKTSYIKNYVFQTFTQVWATCKPPTDRPYYVKHDFNGTTRVHVRLTCKTIGINNGNCRKNSLTVFVLTKLSTVTSAQMSAFHRRAPTNIFLVILFPKFLNVYCLEPINRRQIYLFLHDNSIIGSNTVSTCAVYIYIRNIDVEYKCSSKKQFENESLKNIIFRYRESPIRSWPYKC